MRHTHADPVRFFLLRNIYTLNVALYYSAVESTKESTRYLAHWCPHRTSLRSDCCVLVGESGDCTLWTGGGNIVFILSLTELLCFLLYLSQPVPGMPLNPMHSLAVEEGYDGIRYCGNKRSILPDPDDTFFLIVVSGICLKKVRKQEHGVTFPTIFNYVENRKTQRKLKFTIRRSV
jgi:hypothetical protein